MSSKIKTALTPEELNKLHTLAKQSTVAIEIGSYMGASSVAIASSGLQCLYCVDIWVSNTSLRPDPTDGKTLFEAFTENTREYKNICPIVGYSQEVIRFFLNENICPDLLFIDGDHSYEGAKQDFDLYFPIVKEGGLVVFHDYSFPTVRKVIQEEVISKTVNHNNLPNMWWGRKKS